MLITYHFLFTATVISPIDLDDHSGSALRGSLFEAVWRRFCTNKASVSCAACPLHEICPVSALVAPLREENTRGRDIPRPYVILPPLGDARRYQRGETLQFGITLFGSIIQLLPYVIMSIPELEANGLGRKVVENRGQRGKFQITQIESYHPFNKERRCIYQRGKTMVQASTLSVTQADVDNKAQSLPTDTITLEFLTPARIIDQNTLIHQLNFRSLILRLNERFTNLQSIYGTDNLTQEIPLQLQSTAYLAERIEVSNDQSDIIKLAQDVICQTDETHWEDFRSYSHRQQRSIPISGLMGRITFVGELAPFHKLLTWGELIHVGKSAVKGNGWYKISLEHKR